MVLSPKINAEFIFSKICYADVYALELPGIGLKQAICSPLRTDHSPSLILTIGDSGQMRHKDLAYPDDNRYSGGAVDFVMARYGLDHLGAIKKIAQDFHLLEGNDKYKEITNKFSKPILDQKRTCLIQVSARKWEKRDIDYWNRYLISIDSCKREEIYPIKDFYLNRNKIPMKPGEIIYAYRRPSGFKIYMPERPKGEKWLSNIPLKDAVHLENLSKDYNSLIIPSLKCYMVCTQIYPYVGQIQNESRGALPIDVATRITENSKKVFYGGNQDAPGKVASYRITGDYGWNHINPPDKMLPDVTDWSDWSRKEQSLKGIENHFKSKGLFS